MSAKEQDSERRESRTLSNRPETKLPAIPKGSRIQKRPLPAPQLGRRLANPQSSAPRVDLDSYVPPPRAAHTVVLKVASNTPFMSLVQRVRKALDRGPQKTAGLPLTARVAAMQVQPKRNEALQEPISDALDDVVLVATGRAIQKAIEVGGFFTRRKDVIVLMRTRSVQTIDDVVMADEDADQEDQVRVRYVSCVEVGIRSVA